MNSPAGQLGSAITVMAGGEAKSGGRGSNALRTLATKESSMREEPQSVFGRVFAIWFRGPATEGARW